MNITELYSYDELVKNELEDIEALISLDEIFHDEIVKEIGREYVLGPEEPEVVTSLIQRSADNNILFDEDGVIIGRH